MIGMREKLDWLVPLAVGSVLGVGAVVAGDVFGWSDGAASVAAMAGGMIGVVLRFVMHDYDADLERERAARR